MWEALIGWLKAVLTTFGGKGQIQIGKRNKAVSASSTGENSPVFIADGDIHVSMPKVPMSPNLVKDFSATNKFAELEKTMADLLSDLRKILADHPFLRDIIVLDRESIVYNWPNEHLRFSADKHINIWGKILVLTNQGLVSEIKDRFAYRISEEFATYLRKSNVGGIAAN